MDTRSSAIRAVLLTGAFLLVGSITLGCAGEEERTPLEPVTGLAPTAPNDLLADSSIVADTAYVTAGDAENLVGAVVNEDGSITKGGIDIGSIFPPGPVGPTGTTGVPGTGSGSGGAVPDKAVPTLNPNRPQLEVWCMVRVWYIPSTGEVIDADVLYCWDDGTGNGGTGSGGNNNNQNRQPVTFNLRCDASVTRGENGGCEVTATNEEGEEVSGSEFTFTWSSTSGATDSGKGMSQWYGDATSDVTVTLTVGQFSESRDIDVRLRTDWRTNEFDAVPSYSRALPDHVFGDHRIDPSTPSIPSPKAGSGPWDGQYTAGRAPTVRNRIRIQANYTAAGPTHPNANSVCSTVSFNSNYYRVNDVCGSWDNAMAWHDKVLIHERDHEGEYNQCLRATSVMSQMEEVVESSPSAASRAMMDIWRPFYQNTLRALSITYARAIGTGSDVFWYYNSGWTNSSTRVRAHGNRSNC